MRLIACGLAVAVAAVASSRFMPGPWYEALAKPEWTPPNWLFGPVWTILYVMIAVAGALVWRAGAPLVLRVLWAAQLVLNGIWTPLMFGAHAIGAALIDITLLWLAIAGFVALGWRAGERLAAILLLPYLAWVSYAAALNAAIWRLNG